MDKLTLESFEIYDFDSYKEFLQLLETHTIDKHFEFKISQFYARDELFLFLGIDPENFKAVIEGKGTSSFPAKAESVSSTCSELASNHENPQKVDHHVAIIRNNFAHLVSFKFDVDEVGANCQRYFTEPTSPEEFARLARYFYNLFSNELKEFYFNAELKKFANEPYSKSALISDELFFKVYEQCKFKVYHLEDMTTNLFIEKISQDFLMSLPSTLKKIDLHFAIGVNFWNMSSAMQHLTKIESIVLLGEELAEPKLLIFPQLKSFPNCQYLEISYNLFQDFPEYLKEEFEKAANGAELSKEKIQELSPKVGFQNLNKFETFIPSKEFIYYNQIIQLGIIPSLKEVKFNDCVRLYGTRELKGSIDDTSLERIIFNGNYSTKCGNVEIIRNPITKKFDKVEFDKVDELS